MTERASPAQSIAETMRGKLILTVAAALFAFLGSAAGSYITLTRQIAHERESQLLADRKRVCARLAGLQSQLKQALSSWQQARLIWAAKQRTTELGAREWQEHADRYSLQAETLLQSVRALHGETCEVLAEAYALFPLSQRQIQTELLPVLTGHWGSLDPLIDPIIQAETEDAVNARHAEARKRVSEEVGVLVARPLAALVTYMMGELRGASGGR